jgi:hypothetical protein
MGGTDGRGCESRPLRIVPETGQVSEYGSSCPKGVWYSHVPLSGFHHISVGFFLTTLLLHLGLGGEQAPHIFNDDDRWLEHRDSIGEVGPQARPRPLPEPRPASGGRHILARELEPPAENVYGGNLLPPDLGYISQIRNARTLVFKDLNGGGVDLGMPRDLGVEHHGDGNIQHGHTRK